MTSTAITRYAEAPASVSINTASLRVIAEAAFADYYNTSEAFRRQVTTLPGSYIVSGPVDEWNGAQMFATHCRDVIQGSAIQIAELPPHELLQLYRYLRNKTKTSPSARRTLALKQATAAE